MGDGGRFRRYRIVRGAPPRAALLARPGARSRPYGTLGVGADGAAGYSLIEINTFVRHRFPVIVVIGNDAGWAQIWRDQVALLKDDVCTMLRHSEYHAVAEGIGAAGLMVRDVTSLRGALVQAREIAATGKPVLVNALVDRTEFRKCSISM